MNERIASPRRILTVLLFSRLLMFALFQAAIALCLRSWTASEKYWQLTATLGNTGSLIILLALLKKEGCTYRSLIELDRNKWRQDLPVFLGLTLLAVPVAMVPNFLLSQWLWGDINLSYGLMFRPLPLPLSLVLLAAFPVSIALAELPTYFGYIMPRLKKSLRHKWLGLLLPVIFLSVQHCSLPLIPDPRFLLYRALVFLPFALLLGLVISRRPRLLPYFMVLHGLMDMQTVIMLILKPAS